MIQIVKKLSIGHIKRSILHRVKVHKFDICIVFCYLKMSNHLKMQQQAKIGSINIISLLIVLVILTPPFEAETLTNLTV